MCNHECYSCDLLHAFVKEIIILAVTTLQSWKWALKSLKMERGIIKNWYKINRVQYLIKHATDHKACIYWCVCKCWHWNDNLTLRNFGPREVPKIEGFLGCHGNGWANLIGQVINMIVIHYQSNVYTRFSPVALGYDFCSPMCTPP